jgi:hypothetical protein
MSKPATVSKRYIKARNENALERKMFENNYRHNVSFEYTDIRKVGKHWFAWFEIDYIISLRKQMFKEVKK